MRFTISLIFVVALVLTAMAVNADIPVEYWAGSGSNSALCVVDFDGASYYSFGYKWSTGSPTGFDMISAIADAGGLDIVVQDYGWGAFVDGISYAGHNKGGYSGGENWWHYWINDGSGWVSPAFGASGRTLVNGSTDGWAYGFAGVPGTSTVPEPSALTALVSLIGLVGSAGLLRRRGK